MARGWESKEVESQMEAAEQRVSPSRRQELSPEQASRLREIESVELSRTRVLQDLEAARNPKYRAMLQDSLAFLNQKLAALAAAPEKRE